MQGMEGSMTTFGHWIALALAGGLGTVARACVTTVATRLFGTGFPWGTIAVNALGALAFGVVVGATRSRVTLPQGIETILLVGLLGGFTTFSSYAFQAVELWESGRPGLAFASVVASNLLGFVAVWGGLRLAG
jgi:CrcB protein